MRGPQRLAGLATALGVAVVAVSLALVGSAQAASCAHVSITPGVQSPTLTPKSATIVAGGCAAYTNNTALTVKVTVGKLSASADPNGVVVFLERVPGTFTVTAQEQFQGQGVGGNGTGTLVVRPAPAPKPSATPPPSTRPTATSRPQPSASQSSGPQVAPTTPTQTPPTGPGLTPAPNQSGQGNPPVIVGMPPPTATPSATSPAAVGAQLQPPSGRATGLPAAVAALLVVGAAAAFVRVLLAEPAGAGLAGSGDDRWFVPRAS